MCNNFAYCHDYTLNASFKYFKLIVHKSFIKSASSHIRSMYKYVNNEVLQDVPLACYPRASGAWGPGSL